MPVDTKQLRKMARESESIDLFEDAEALTAAADEIDALRERVAEIPSWQDKPTCEGWYFLLGPDKWSSITYYGQNEQNAQSMPDSIKWFGPIPLPTEGGK